MLEKLQYDLSNYTDVEESTEVASLSSKNKESLNRNAASLCVYNSWTFSL